VDFVQRVKLSLFGQVRVAFSGTRNWTEIVIFTEELEAQQLCEVRNLRREQG